MGPIQEAIARGWIGDDGGVHGDGDSGGGGSNSQGGAPGVRPDRTTA